MGITVSGVDEDPLFQDSLFTAETDASQERLSEVLDDLQSKFGDTAIMSGALWKRHQSGIGEHYPTDARKATEEATDT